MFQVIAIVLLCVVLAALAFVAFAIAVAAKAKLRDGKHDIYDEHATLSSGAAPTIDHIKYASTRSRIGEPGSRDVPRASPGRS